MQKPCAPIQHRATATPGCALEAGPRSAGDGHATLWRSPRTPASRADDAQARALRILSLVRIAESPPRIPFARLELAAGVEEACARVLASGWLTSGPEVLAFEQELSEHVGAAHGVAVSSCTAALEIALRALRLRPGARVLTSTMTFCGAVHAIVHAGLQPVLVDVDPVTAMPDAETTAAARRRAGGVDAMVVTHYAGHPAPVEELAEAAGISTDVVVEDAAHALGTWLGDRPVGAISRATCFSFYATKNLPIGEGGMLTTADGELAALARSLRLHGMSHDAWRRYLPGGGWRYEVDEDGLKANLTDLAAAVGRAQLRGLPSWQAAREARAADYDTGLRFVPGLELPARPAAGRHAWHLYVIRVRPGFPMHRDRLLAELSERGIDCSVHFIPIHHHAYFRRFLGDDACRLPGADRLFEEIASLPLYPALAREQVERVCQAISDLGGPRR